jgi:hypothetical protein
MEYRGSFRVPLNILTDSHATQKEQREELAVLLRKYGKDWEPWRKELEKFKGKGEELIKR